MSTPENILRQWLNAFGDGDIETLVSMYDERAVLIPTFSNMFLNSSSKIKDYFIKLSTRESLSVELHDKTITVHQLSNSIYSLCGIYCFKFAIDGELLSFESRFSFIIDVKSPKPILQHHSSQIPRII